jgi:2-polyprenyl-3-methyl-5-hydroxy-6-metoxy-1,4-benzoquinol methylase
VTGKDENRTLLDLGCGHGIFLALAKKMRPGLSLVGIDLDPDKINQAKVAFEKAKISGQKLSTMSITDFPEASVDYIAILDVMYLVPLVLWAGILKTCYDSLKPDGLLLMKEMNTKKPAKLAVLKLEESLAVKVLGITKGENETFTFPAPEEIRKQMKEVGFEVEEVPLDQGYHVPHMLWIGHKPNQLETQNASAEPKQAE